jgi:hypothetical protein
MSTLQQSNLDGGAKRKTKKIVKKRGGTTTCWTDAECVKALGSNFECDEGTCEYFSAGGAKRKTKKIVKKKRGGGDVCTFDPNDPNGGVCGTIKEGDVCRRIFSSANAVCVSREYADRLDADKAEKEVKLEAMRADMAARAAEYGGAKRKTKKVLKKKQKGGGKPCVFDAICDTDEFCSKFAGKTEGECWPKNQDGGESPRERSEREAKESLAADLRQQERNRLSGEDRWGGAKRKTKKVVKKKQKEGGGGTLCGNNKVCRDNQMCTHDRMNETYECVDNDWNVGGGPTKAVYKGGSYVVHIGKRGGKYIVVKGTKVYVNKK